jgi:hypothetical protein
MDRAGVLAAALWWGSLTAIGFLAVPLLFAHAPSRSMAGYLAARLFTGQAWLSLGCAMFLLMWVRRVSRNELLGWILGGVLLALLIEFAVAPRIVTRQNLALWHTVGTAMYAVQWLCAGVLVWKLSRPSS